MLTVRSVNSHLIPANDYRISDHVKPSYHHFRLLDQRITSLDHVRPDGDNVDQQKTSLNQLMTILDHKRPSNDHLRPTNYHMLAW